MAGCPWVTGYSELIVWKDCNFRLVDILEQIATQPAMSEVYFASNVNNRGQVPAGVRAK